MKATIHLPLHTMGINKGSKGRAVPRIVCCAIPISRAGQVLVVTSRKRPNSWVLPKGGWESTDGQLEAAASREALEEAGVRGTITRYVITIPTPSATYHFYELDVKSLDQDWLEQHERQREWVDYAEAIRRLEWKTELAEGLKSSSLASRAGNAEGIKSSSLAPRAGNAEGIKPSSLAPRAGKTELAEAPKSSSLAPRAELLSTSTKSFFSGRWT